jgi:long-chain acyl-CoA synthetase
VKSLGTMIEKRNLAPLLREYKSYELGNVGIFSKNREEWVVLELTGVLYNKILIPFYDTLGP